LRTVGLPKLDNREGLITGGCYKLVDYERYYRFKISGRDNDFDYNLKDIAEASTWPSF
jgi:hypothetical protein